MIPDRRRDRRWSGPVTVGPDREAAPRRFSLAPGRAEGCHPGCHAGPPLRYPEARGDARLAAVRHAPRHLAGRGPLHRCSTWWAGTVPIYGRSGERWCVTVRRFFWNCI